MYTPKHFQMSDDRYADLINNNPFVMILSEETPALFTQCPVLYDQTNHCLYGHLAIGNNFLDTVKEKDPISVLVTGAQGYISANWYQETSHYREVPTWNYESLLIKGTIAFADEQNALVILRKLTNHFESRVDENWSIDKLTETQQRAMVKGIRAFTITIDELMGKSKLSQNKPVQTREKLIRNIGNKNQPSYQSLLDAMINTMSKP